MKKELLNKKIGVILTDTIYGIVGLALDENVVQRIYKIKNRNPQKPFIVLISSIEDLKSIFKIDIEYFDILKEFWPGKTSVILPCNEFPHLHRGLNSIAFRVPDKKELVDLIKEVGPIVATSVNKEGDEPAKNIDEAKKYFGEEIDFYIDSKECLSEPSILVNIKNKNELEILRGKICLKK
ncbi:MAG: L-threonylcarbamoyladenylate synthase [Candidatus Pacebacteria bacterium]|nr:L-threonylcarbamoyladenylate synthase [Candidatus Paceibacterota bacterium]